MDTGVASTKKSDRVIDKIVVFLTGGELSKEELTYYRDLYVFPIRKSAHLFLYFMLGVSVLLFLKEYGSIQKKGILISICFVFIYACSDEIHQLFVPDRSGEIADVLLDTLGGYLGIMILYYYYQWRIHYEQKKAIS